MVQAVGLQVGKRDPAHRVRAWRATAAAVEQVRADVETQLGAPVFVIADERERASQLSFYFRDRRTEGPRHPPVYITESQAITNQFSFWPRYDEFVAAPKPAEPAPAEGDTYTEEDGVNLFTGRSAIFVQSGNKEAPRNITAAFSSVERFATIGVRRYGRPLRTLQVFVCRNYRTLPL
jgi:hypothetical protein